jgi:hypothetical protein
LRRRIDLVSAAPVTIGRSDNVASLSWEMQ